jgi:hypothetical protein
MRDAPSFEDSVIEGAAELYRCSSEEAVLWLQADPTPDELDEAEEDLRTILPETYPDFIIRSMAFWHVLRDRENRALLAAMRRWNQRFVPVST